MLINQRFDKSVLLLSYPKVGKSDWLAAWFESPANAQSEYLRLLRLNGLLPTNPTNSIHLTRCVAMNLYQLAQAARDASVYLMKNHRKPERDLYVKDILENAKKKNLTSTGDRTLEHTPTPSGSIPTAG